MEPFPALRTTDHRAVLLIAQRTQSLPAVSRDRGDPLDHLERRWIGILDLGDPSGTEHMCPASPFRRLKSGEDVELAGRFLPLDRDR